MSFQLKEYERLIKIASEEIPELLEHNDGVIERSIINSIKERRGNNYRSKPFQLYDVSDNIVTYYADFEFPILLNTINYLNHVKDFHYEIIDKLSDHGTLTLKFNEDDRKDCLSIRYDYYNEYGENNELGDAIILEIDRKNKGRIKLNDIDEINKNIRKNNL